MQRTVTVLAAAVLAAACAEIPEAPPSLADQFAEQRAERSDDDSPAEPADEEVDGTQSDDPAPGAGDNEIAADDDEAALRQAVADADARCAAIYTHGDELAREHLDLEPGRSPEDIDAELDVVFELTRSLTEEVVESLEQGARDDARLEPIASTARNEMLPIFLELIDLMASADEAELEAAGAQAWPRLSGFVDELASLGFRHCFQEQSLVT